MADQMTLQEEMADWFAHLAGILEQQTKVQQEILERLESIDSKLSADSDGFVSVPVVGTAKC